MANRFATHCQCDTRNKSQMADHHYMVQRSLPPVVLQLTTPRTAFGATLPKGRRCRCPSARMNSAQA